MWMAASHNPHGIAADGVQNEENENEKNNNAKNNGVSVHEHAVCGRSMGTITAR